jgi:hypothetical protein
MFKIKKILFFSFLILLISACASSPSSRSKEPSWVYDPGSVYPGDLYVSAVGYGPDRSSAEKNALGALISIFSQSVQGEIRTSQSYSEALSGGIIDTREQSEIFNAVKTSFAMDTLIGAEIKDGWFDGEETHYAVAVMDKMQCGLLYSDLIESNRQIIQNLINVPEKELYTLDTYARYNLAGTIADANTAFINVFSVINPIPASLLRRELRPGEDYRLEGKDLCRNITMAVKVDNDPGGRIGAAFSAVLTGAGFRLDAGNPRYVLEVAVTLADVELHQNQNKFIRYVIDSRLIETASGQTLFPYAINGREGHLNRLEAENRAIRVAEEKIRSSYAEELVGYLSRLSSISVDKY